MRIQRKNFEIEAFKQTKREYRLEGYVMLLLRPMKQKNESEAS